MSDNNFNKFKRVLQLKLDSIAVVYIRSNDFIP